MFANAPVHAPATHDAPRDERGPATRARRGLVRDRERISDPLLLALLACALAPLLLVTLRLLAVADSALVGPVAFGEWLNRSLALGWIPAGDRDMVLYILLLPLAALLTAFTRLTLGIRVLGFRAILIAIGFQEIGPLPSLLLIVVIATTVVAVRPLMRRIGMPLYARVAAILCIVALTMVAGLLAGSWLDSATLWSMAFFPVVILAMLAESVADTVARENVAMAAWRTGSTITLAALLAVLGQLTPVRELVLACPELVITQLALIVFVSEFLDLRLLEPLQARLTTGRSPARTRATVVVVRNRFSEPPLIRRTPTAPKRYRGGGLQHIIDSLRDLDFAVRVAEGDDRLAQCLRDEYAQRRAGGDENLVVMNLAGGAHGAARLAQVPMLCDMLGVPFTGPRPQAPALLGDLDAQQQVLASAGLAVPRRLTVSQAEEFLASPDAAVKVRPRHQADRRGRIVRQRRELRGALEQQARYGESVIEVVGRGRLVTAVLLWDCATASPEALPLVEAASGTYRASRHLPDTARSAAADAARRAALALGCRDLACIELCLGPGDSVTVLHVAAIELPRARGAIACAVAAAGLTTRDLAHRILGRALVEAGIDAGSHAVASYQTTHHPHAKEITACVTSASSVTV